MFIKAFFFSEKGRRSLVDIISSGTKKVWDKKVPNTQMEQLKSIIQDKYGVKFGKCIFLIFAS